MDIIITIIATFVITALWQKWADRKSKLPLRVTIQGLGNELNNMAKELGYNGVEEYWIETKGEDYMQVAVMNYNNALDSLK